MYINPTTKRRCKDYALAWLVAEGGGRFGVCEKHAGSLKALLEKRTGQPLRIEHRLMEQRGCR